MKNLAELQDVAIEYSAGKISRNTFLSRISKFLHSLSAEELKEVAEHISDLPTEEHSQ